MRHLFHFQIIPFQQLARVFQSGVRQVLIETHCARFLEQMRQVVWGDIKRLRDGFPGKGSGVVFVNIDPNRFKQSGCGRRFGSDYPAGRRSG